MSLEYFDGRARKPFPEFCQVGPGAEPRSQRQEELRIGPLMANPLGGVHNEREVPEGLAAAAAGEKGNEGGSRRHAKARTKLEGPRRRAQGARKRMPDIHVRHAIL